MITIDPVFEAAVDADLCDRATSDQRALVEDDPPAWRAALAVRRSMLARALAQGDSALVEVIEVVEGRELRTFTVTVRGQNRDVLLRKLQVLEQRTQRSRHLQRQRSEMDQRVQKGRLEGLVAYATPHVPRDTPEGRAWWAALDAHCATFRGNHPLSPATHKLPQADE